MGWSVSIIPRVQPLAGIVALCMGMSACGTLSDQPTSQAEGMELTWVYIEQHTIPGMANNPQQPSALLVTGDVTIVFRYADHPTTLVIDFSGKSGQLTHNEIDLAALKPAIVEATEGRWKVRAPLEIPELGPLQFSAVLKDLLGRSSSAIGGSFTVEDGFGAGNGTQTSQDNTTGNTTGNTTTVSGGS